MRSLQQYLPRHRGLEDEAVVCLFCCGCLRLSVSVQSARQRVRTSRLVCCGGNAADSDVITAKAPRRSPEPSGRPATGQADHTFHGGTAVATIKSVT